MTPKLHKIMIVLFVGFIIFIYIKTYHSSYLKFQLNNQSIMTFSQNRIITRDFLRIDCKNTIRIGGPTEYVKNAPSPLYRIDGSWFICLDDHLAPKKNKCNVLSFGINNDYSFDEVMNKEYGCRVFSFDPFVEAGFFNEIRSSNKELAQSSIISINPKWTFYR